MPHLRLGGDIDFERTAGSLPRGVTRWGRAVLKTEECWMRRDRRALLVEGVVVELSRPLHPVALVATATQATTVRLWPVVAVERTPAIQRWLCVLVHDLQELGGGPVTSTNIDRNLWQDLDLVVGS